MTESNENSLIQTETQLGKVGNRIFMIALSVGVVALVVAVGLGFQMNDGFKQFLNSYLVGFCFFLSLSLGALFWVILQHLTRSFWGVVIRRIAENLSANLLLLGVLSIPILIGIPSLYIWADQSIVAHNEILQAKQVWLNQQFFTIRIIFYFAVWILLSQFFLRNSVSQDKSSDYSPTLKSEKYSALAMVLFALTINFAAFDLIMSLTPLWFSTIFGVYFFGASVMGFTAFITIAICRLQGLGKLKNEITVEHFHDLGKQMFSSVFFWGYVAFSQFMLMWYANIPEETIWYLPRMTTSWVNLSWILLFGHFFIPFLILLTREIKRTKTGLLIVAFWLIIMHYIDIYWLIMPQFSPDGLSIHILDVLCPLGIGGLFMAGIAKLAMAKSLIPSGDPRLDKSLEFKNSP